MEPACSNVKNTNKKQVTPLAPLAKAALAAFLLALLPATVLAGPIQLHGDGNGSGRSSSPLSTVQLHRLDDHTGDGKTTPEFTPTYVALKRYSDLAIGVAYFAIPLEIAFFALRLPTLNVYQKAVAGLLFAFIILCGMGHTFEWRQMTWGWVVGNRVATAVVSILTACLFPHVLSNVVAGVNKSMKESRLLEKQRDMLNDAQALTHLGSWELGGFEAGQLAEIEASDEWFHILGIKPSPSNNRVPFDRYLDCVDPEERVAIQDAIKNALVTGECFNFVQRVHREVDEKECYLRVFGKPLDGGDGGEPHVKGRLRGTAQDITTQVIAERELVRAKEAAIIEAKHKDVFLANVSHELRTPLTSICGHVDLMGETTLDPLQQEYMNSAKRAATTLLCVINDLLDYSKLMAGMVDLDPTVVPLDEVLTDIHAITRDLGKDDVDLRVHSHTGLHVLLDSARLRQILLNLVSNAVKFSRGKGGVVEVSCVHTLPTPETANITLSVRDTGIGISASALPRLFQPFVQADVSISRRFGGTGLGLSIVKKLVTAMGGAIHVESTVGVGSTFTITLTAPTAAPPVATIPQVLSAGGLRILIAEDNPVTQKLLSRMLKPCEVVLADNGLIAVELIRTRGKDFDLLLSDVNMPEMDGLTATRLIRTLPEGRDLYIIGLTANGFKKDRDECLAAGMDAYLSKPFTKAGLLTVINQGRDRLVNSVSALQHPLPSTDFLASCETLANGSTEQLS
ncbi:hypothetical protein HDU86_007970 [Geranomyces michiganensis]|nr:hypothetical protein HDU86_007970 [Geranomyces michiganensis]